MGCNQSINDVINQTNLVDPSQHTVGILKIKIRNIKLKKLYQAPENYCLRVWVTNQLYEYALHEALDSDAPLEMVFILNSKYRFYGRSLNMQICHILHPSSSNTLFGLQDLDKLFDGTIRHNHTNQIHLNYSDKQGGCILYEPTFEKVNYERIKVEIEAPIFKQMKSFQKILKVKFVVGEELYEFKFQKPKKGIKDVYISPQIFVPYCLSTANLEIFEDKTNSKNLLTSCVINLKSILTKSQKETIIDEPIYSGNKHIGSIKLKINKIRTVQLTEQSQKQQRQLLTSIKVIEPMENKEDRNPENTSKKIPLRLPPISMTVRTQKKLKSKKVKFPPTQTNPQTIP